MRLRDAGDEVEQVVRILVTNDDGIDAPGIAALAAGLSGTGHDLVVAAPWIDASGSSAAVGPRPPGTAPIFTPVDPERFGGQTAYRVDAFPALIVYEACRGVIGAPPDLVLSGINLGRNVGGAVVHSGTVGAAVTAAQLGRSALALSIQARGPEIHFETAAELARRLLGLLASLREGTVLNCNVPNVSISALRGVRVARLSRTGPILPATASSAGSGRPRSSGTSVLPEAETDDQLSQQGYATITPLLPVSEDRDPGTAETLRGSLETLAAELGSPVA